MWHLYSVSNQTTYFIVSYRFPRSPFIYDEKMISVDIEFHNSTETPMEGIAIGNKVNCDYVFEDKIVIKLIKK